MALWSLYVLFIGLSAADGVLTHRVLARGGFESNPLIAYAYRKGGVAGLALIKLLIGSYVAFLLLTSQLPLWAIGLCVVVYALVVAHLRRELRKLEYKARAVACTAVMGSYGPIGVPAQRSPDRVRRK